MEINSTYTVINRYLRRHADACKRFTTGMLFLIAPLFIFSQNELAFSGSGFAARTGDTSDRSTAGDTSVMRRPGDYNDDEVLITLNVQRIGSVEIMAYIYGEEAYLPVKDLFDFLKIRNTLSPNLDSVQGYIMNPKEEFIIDKVNNRIGLPK